MQDMLDGFIRKFVLCPECDNPETDLVTISLHLGDGGVDKAERRSRCDTAGWLLLPSAVRLSFLQHVNPKKQTIGNSCKACGYRGMLDTRHKLCTFILKNPPGKVSRSPDSLKRRKQAAVRPARRLNRLSPPRQQRAPTVDPLL